MTTKATTTAKAATTKATATTAAAKAATTKTATRATRGKATRDLLVDATAREVNARGYFGTDSNRIARAAGFSPATFYKHFPDKRDAFLAAYERWVGSEWDGIARVLGRVPRAQAARPLVALLVRHHRRWRGLRASLRTLVASDRDVRSFQVQQRARQLDLLAALRAPERATPRQRADDLMLLLAVERICDALADGEAGELGVPAAAATAHLETLLAAALAR